MKKNKSKSKEKKIEENVYKNKVEDVDKSEDATTVRNDCSNSRGSRRKSFDGSFYDQLKYYDSNKNNHKLQIINKNTGIEGQFLPFKPKLKPRVS